jgi:hypothetical protein
MITLKAEACAVCGSPQHGMLQPDLPLPFDVDVDRTQEDGGGNLRRPLPGRAS